MIRKIIKINEEKCNGCGECIPACHEGALSIVNGKAKMVNESACDGLGACIGECPQGAITIIEEEIKAAQGALITQWPIQINLVPAFAPFLENADLLVAADCVAFAYADFHKDLLKSRVLLVGCPKLDDIARYQEKFKQIFKNNNIKSVTYSRMEVPCCFGLTRVLKEAISESGKNIPFEEVIISIQGKRLKNEH